MKQAKRMLKLYSLAFFMVLLCSGDGDSSFTLALLPDTQTYTEAYPEILNAQTNWIAKNAENISFVLQQGDITDDNTEPQWKTAAAAFCQMDGKIPYTFVPGNHDVGEGGKTDVRITSLFNQYFPYEKYSREPTFRGAFITGEMDNTWHAFSAGGYDWLIISLEFAPRTSVLNWAGKIIEEHPKHKVIINTHAYLYSDNHRISEIHGHNWLPKDYGIGKVQDPEAVNDGEQMWEKLISNYPNILLVFCGHVLNNGTGLLVSEGKYGNKVYQMLANYQGGVEGSVNGGNGFLRLITIDPKNASISVKTYSPYLGEYKTDSTQQFIIEDVKF